MFRALRRLLVDSASQLDLFGSPRLSPPSRANPPDHPAKRAEPPARGATAAPPAAERPEPPSRPGTETAAPATLERRAIAASELFARLRALGLRGIDYVRLTSNRSTMVSFRAPELRVHEAFLSASEDVLRAIVVFVNGRGSARRAARRVITAFEIPRRPGPRRRERLHPDDRPLVARLEAAHAELNQARFGGTLGEIRVHVSRRMRTMLGHYAPGTADGDPAHIAISRRHIRRHGWHEAIETLLHEMVHQWQHETHRPLDHAREFRRKARAVGIVPSARRAPGSASRATRDRDARGNLGEA